MFVSSFSRGRAAHLVFAASAALALAVPAVFGGTTTGDFASSVVSFNQGTGLPANYFNDATSALGAPSAVVGAGSIFPNVLDPFSPAFGKNEIVVIGKGGQLTLKLATAVTVANTRQIGVISNVGLIDSSYPNAQATAPASIFGGGVADVRVSSDDKTWQDLGNITFNVPASAWSKLGSAYETAPGTSDVGADFSKPFAGTLSSFSGQTLAQTLQTLNGSVGGTWLNLSGTKLKTVDYIQFRNPSGSTSQLAIDAVIATASTGGGGNPSAVPLPPAAPVALAMLGVGIVARLRRRNTM